MKRYQVISSVYIEGIGHVKDEYIQEFEDELNVFGRVLKYHERMYEVFPNCPFCLIEANEV
jgi:hypothetical protein